MELNEIIYGGIYRANQQALSFSDLPNYTNRLNDQKYNYWIPIRVKSENLDKDCIYMIDTYQFDMPYNCRKDYNKMVEYLQSLAEDKDGNNYYKARKAYDYYYSALVKLNDINIKHFTLLVDLSEWTKSTGMEIRYYNNDDTYSYLMLWKYHNSGSGMFIKKKNAKLSYDLKIDSMCNDILYNYSMPIIYDNEVRRVLEVEKEAIKNNAEYNVNKVKYLLEVQRTINNLKNDYKEQMGRLKRKYFKVEINDDYQSKTKEKKNEKKKNILS